MSTTTDFQLFRKKEAQPMRPYIMGETLPENVSISDADKANGSPKEGDMIARSANDPTDLWLVSKKFFEENYVAL